MKLEKAVDHSKAGPPPDRVNPSPEECPLRRWDHPDCPCEKN